MDDLEQLMVEGVIVPPVRVQPGPYTCSAMLVGADDRQLLICDGIPSVDWEQWNCTRMLRLFAEFINEYGLENTTEGDYEQE